MYLLVEWRRVSTTNESTTVKLSLLNQGRKVTEATYGREYELQAEMDAPSGNQQTLIKKSIKITVGVNIP